MAATGAIATARQSKSVPDGDVGLISDAPLTSHRLIVELESPAFVASSVAKRSATTGQMDVSGADAQVYINRLQQEQAEFVSAMQRSVPNAKVATFKDENGRSVSATYQVLFNGVAIDAGQGADASEMREALLKMANVKAVYFDYAYTPDTYTSLSLINAPAAWDSAAIGGKANAGKGIMFASVDGGLHHDAPMFSGDGWAYPAGWPTNGKGDSANNNGKIIASRVYFRDWDPPLAGDENSWPGEAGTSHGVHTGSTAVGNVVETQYLGSETTEILSGVAPAAWAMSYRVFYPSNGPANGSAFSVELMAAIEDAVADGAQVINNSWGGGPGSFGGEFDALDKALVNAVNAGVFLSMSAGNSGPGSGTGDHPSNEYINVAASTTDGTYAAGTFNIIGPEPLTGSVQMASFGSAGFGSELELGSVITFEYVTAAALEPTNTEGCDPFIADFTDKAVLISRGDCDFSEKVYHAQEAGAEFVVIYNNRDGDAFLNMAAGDNAGQVNISSVMISQNNGDNAVAWYATHGAASALSVDSRGFQAGNDPDQIAGFSSRGPSAGQGLRPDIAAPGVNILAQGYGQGTGEARHLGYGQVSGTSMAAPHVAGAAVLLRQMYPTWGMAEIKAAMMGSAKYMEIYNGDGSPAQPLDMGAGRLDFTQIVSPGVGVLLNPPSVSFGYVPTGTAKSMKVQVTSVATASETYVLSTLFTGDSFTATTNLPGFTVSPMTLTLAAGESAVVTIEFDPATGQGLGDNQGYLILDGATYDSHAAMWGRVLPEATADVLIIDADFSSELGLANYLSYYTDALDELGMSYAVYDTVAGAGSPATIPSATELAAYKAVILATGDNYQPNGTFVVSTIGTQLDKDRLTEYANAGGIIIAMGQDLSGVLGDDATGRGSFFYNTVLGSDWLKDSVSGSVLPSLPVNAAPDAPAALDGTWVDLSQGVQSLKFTSVSSNTASGSVIYNLTTNELTYLISVSAYTSTLPVTVTNAHIHTGTVGITGSVAVGINVTPMTITETGVVASGTVTLTQAQEAVMLADGYYFNVHTSANDGGEMRAQIPAVNGDGASNQAYVDEIRVPYGVFIDGGVGFIPLMTYPNPANVEDGIVAMMRRDQPSLERPGISSNVRSIYTTFGLEGVNDGTATDRAELLGLFMDMLMDEPVATISSNGNIYTSTAQAIPFTAELTTNITGTTGSTYRWDFGDGSAIVDSDTVANVSHQFAADACGRFDVRVEITDTLGNVSIGKSTYQICNGKVLDESIYLPIIFGN